MKDKPTRKIPDTEQLGHDSEPVMKSDSSDWPAGFVIQREFRIEKLLGKGGMGSVYLVRRLSDNQLYALKTIHLAKLINPTQRRLFFREIRTWINLPTHPNLVNCWFIRLFDDRPAIFAEYVDGGSLLDWIKGNRFTSIESILDVAIQTAWGLEAAHENGIVHQDIKPANIMISKEGVAKITDFGISKAQGIPSILNNLNTEMRSSSLVSSDGMTIAYCSPEQSCHSMLNHKTDIWSWGVSILQIFVGSVKWSCGAFINGVLKKMRRDIPEYSVHDLPVQLYAILERCFEEDPADRWSDFGEISQALCVTFESLVGRPYPRHKPEGKPVITSKRTHERRTAHGCIWRDPREWLDRVQELTGMAKDVPKLQNVKPTSSRDSQHVADIEILDIADRKYQMLVNGGQEDLLDELAALLQEKAWLYESLRDFPSAMNLYSRILTIRTRLVRYDPSVAAKYRLGLAWMFYGAAAFYQGRKDDAMTGFTESIDTLEPILPAGYEDTMTRLIWAYMNRATVFNRTNYSRKSLVDTQKAIDIFNEYAPRELRRYSLEMALVFMNRASVMVDLGEYVSGALLLRKACVILRKRFKAEPDIQNQVLLSTALMQLANSQAAMGDLKHSHALNMEARELMVDLIENKGYNDIENRLAIALHNDAEVSLELNRPENGLKLLDKAIQLVEKMKLAGRRDIDHLLPHALHTQACIYHRLGKFMSALNSIESSMKEYRKLLGDSEEKAWLPDIAKMKIIKGDILFDFGKKEEAENILQEVITQMDALKNEDFGTKCMRIARRARHVLSSKRRSSL